MQLLLNTFGTTDLVKSRPTGSSEPTFVIHRICYRHSRLVCELLASRDKEQSASEIDKSSRINKLAYEPATEFEPGQAF